MFAFSVEIRYVTGGPGTDVYYDSEGIRKHGIWNSGWNPVFVLVLCAALTSSIALTESAVSTFQDELKWGRKKATVFVGVVMVVLGSLSSLGYGPLACVKTLECSSLFLCFLTELCQDADCSRLLPVF